jgi:hypothetical protein
MPMRVLSVLAVTAALLLQLAACGGSSTGVAGETENEAPAVAAEAPEQAATGSWAELKRYAGPNADKLIIPRGPSPDHVVIRDLEVGNGPPIEAGDVFYSRYVSFDYENEEIDEPLPGEGTGRPPWVDAGSLKWGTGERVPGWEPGLKGIRAGGLRELIVPSRLAYENGVRVYLVKVTKIRP